MAGVQVENCDVLNTKLLSYLMTELKKLSSLFFINIRLITNIICLIIVSINLFANYCIHLIIYDKRINIFALDYY